MSRPREYRERNRFSVVGVRFPVVKFSLRCGGDDLCAWRLSNERGRTARVLLTECPSERTELYRAARNHAARAYLLVILLSADPNSPARAFRNYAKRANQAPYTRTAARSSLLWSLFVTERAGLFRWFV